MECKIASQIEIAERCKNVYIWVFLINVLNLYKTFSDINGKKSKLIYIKCDISNAEKLQMVRPGFNNAVFGPN